LILSQETYDSLIVLIDIALKKEDYKKVINLYEEALETGMDDKNIVSKLKDLIPVIQELKNGYEDQAGVAENAGREDLRKNASTKGKNMKALLIKVNSLIKKVEK